MNPDPTPRAYETRKPTESALFNSLLAMPEAIDRETVRELLGTGAQLVEVLRRERTRDPQLQVISQLMETSLTMPKGSRLAPI